MNLKSKLTILFQYFLQSVYQSRTLKELLQCYMYNICMSFKNVPEKLILLSNSCSSGRIKLVESANKYFYTGWFTNTNNISMLASLVT